MLTTFRYFCWSTLNFYWRIKEINEKDKRYQEKVERFINGTPRDEEKEDYQTLFYGTHDESACEGEEFYAWIEVMFWLTLCNLRFIIPVTDIVSCSNPTNWNDSGLRQNKLKQKNQEVNSTNIKEERELKHFAPKYSESEWPLIFCIKFFAFSTIL